MLQHFSPTAPHRMLDVGCGSGILSIVAAKLGVPEILAIDIDPGTVRVAARVASGNEVADQVTAAHTDVADVQGQYPWVIANIQAEGLVELADSLVARVAPGGKLLLSGITEAVQQTVQNTYRQAADRAQRPDFEVVERDALGLWRSLLLSDAPTEDG